MFSFIGAVQDGWQLFSNNPLDYTIGPTIGFGASSVVSSAFFHPSLQPSNPIPCALKVLNLDLLPPNALRLLQRETTLMSLSKHPNVLRVRGTWIDGHYLYIAMRLMNKGSAADVMRYGWPGGLEEEVIKCILKQALEGLNYLHINGFIHRDVKAANLLIDDDGTVLLGDLGVAVSLNDSNHANHTSQRSRPKIGKRKSFVGTSQSRVGCLRNLYKAINTTQHLIYGLLASQPLSWLKDDLREAAKVALLCFVQDSPPALDREGGVYKYSRAFKEIVDSCLAKDPAKRPSASELLSSPFFRSAKRKSYLVTSILQDLPPLASRQERRRVPSRANAAQHTTVSSWDFSHSHSHSHTHSHSHSHLRQLSSNHSASEESSPEKVLREPGAEDEKIILEVAEEPESPENGLQPTVHKEHAEEEVDITPASGAHEETVLARAPTSKSTSGRLSRPQTAPVSGELTPVSTSSASDSVHSSSSLSSSASHVLLRWLSHKRDGSDGGTTVKTRGSGNAKRGGKMRSLLGLPSAATRK